MKDEGFSLVEAMAALMILSLAAVFLGEAISHMVAGWTRTEKNIAAASQLERVLPELGAAERQLKQTNLLGTGPLLAIDDGPPLELSSPRIDKTADCVFDMVGRRCR